MAEAALTFNEVAELYHEIRPRYPERLFADLVKLTNLPDNARVLEIGAGTGIATVELARRGFRVVALEPGPAMAAILKRNLKDCHAEVVESKFEDWEPPVAKFDLVVSFTAFHWLDPQTRFQRTCELLTPSGYLGIIKYHHVAGRDRAFFEATQEYYKKYLPHEPEFHLPEVASFKPGTQELIASGLYREPLVRTYPAEETYQRADYEKLLLTYSDHRLLEEPRRSELLNCIGDLIDRRFGGKVRKQYLHELVLARKN
jgi:SAM-dependent methyltransferase